MSPKRKKAEAAIEVVTEAPAVVMERPTIQRGEATIQDRMYETLESTAGERIIIGPHEGLVDELGLSADAATKLHNILYRRKLFNYAACARHPQEVAGAIQEFYQMDVQKLMEKFFTFEQEVPHG